MRSGNRGFTLIEAVAAAALLAVGIVACLNAIGAIDRAADRSIQREDMERLAMRKYVELLALGTFTTGEASGDFADIGDRKYSWSARWSTTDVKNLNLLQVDVSRIGSRDNDGFEVDGLHCSQVSSK